MKTFGYRAHIAKLPSLLFILLIGSAGAEDKPTLAIVDFEGFGVSPTEAIGLTNRLRNEIFRNGHFDVVDRGMMQSILAEQDFQLSACTSNECLVEVGQLLGAQQMIGGSITKIGSMYTVSARLVDVETGRVIKVSDYDIRGGLEELLTIGMSQVAGMFSPAITDVADGRDEEPLIVEGEGQANISESPPKIDVEDPKRGSLSPTYIVGEAAGRTLAGTFAYAGPYSGMIKVRLYQPLKVAESRLYIDIGFLEMDFWEGMYSQIGLEKSKLLSSRWKTSTSLGLGLGADGASIIPLLSGGIGISYNARLFADPTFQGLLHLTPYTGFSPMVSVRLQGSLLQILGTGLAGIVLLSTLVLLLGGTL